MANIRFGYFQVRVFWDEGNAFVVPKRPGIVTAALIRPEKGSNEPYQIGFSFCSPLDPFNKKHARKVALARLEHPRSRVVFSFDGEKLSDAFFAGLKAASVTQKPTTKLGEIRTEVMVPKWVVRALDHNNVQFGLTTQRTSNISFVDVEEINLRNEAQEAKAAS